MKITVVGGGSTYTPELIGGFIERLSSLPLEELWLMDIDPERLKIVGGFAKRIVHARGNPFHVVLSSNLKDSIYGSSYVITQLRVGGMEARRRDEYLGRKYGLIGQETTGIGGMAKALRTIPVNLEIARIIAENAPDAVLLNFTNPSGLITEAIQRVHPGITSAGVCNAPINFKMGALSQWESITGNSAALDDVFLDTLGLNHLSWHRGMTIKGENVWPMVVDHAIQMAEEDEAESWRIPFIQNTNMIPNYYLAYYYNTEYKLAVQQKWPPSRAEEVIEIEKRLLAKYAEPARDHIPEEIMERGGAYYSTLAAKVINSHFNDLGEIHEVNVRNEGAVRDWPADWVLEIPCRINRSGISPLVTDPLPDVSYGLLTAVISYERLTVNAVLENSYQAAKQALLVHPLGPDIPKIQELLDEMIEINKEFFPVLR
ncbi:MAG: 6-phospho-beta-glucosidase [Anaerolineales bacterium]|nr:6-phospho-beta-glucosidase [Anaerolineales bacterium]